MTTPSMQDSPACVALVVQCSGNAAQTSDGLLQLQRWWLRACIGWARELMASGWSLSGPWNARHGSSTGLFLECIADLQGGNMGCRPCLWSVHEEHVCAPFNLALRAQCIAALQQQKSHWRSVG